jgi:tellurite resistance protein TerC
MDAELIVWIALVSVVGVGITIDLISLRGEVSLRASLIWTAIWTVLGVGFTVVVWRLKGVDPGNEYLTGYLLERSLSFDNVFVFAVIFSYFAVPPGLQTRALMWGVIGALALRGIFIVIGASLLETFAWMIFVFGGFLVITGVRLAFTDEESADPGKNLALRLFRRVVPVSAHYAGDRLTVVEAGRRIATPMVAVLLVIATTDLIFAIDSIPAIFAVTDDPFIVFAANAFAIMGLRALYFVLADMMHRFEYLKYGLAAVLVLVGLKMILQDLWHIPAWGVLLLVLLLVGGSILWSLYMTRNRAPDAAHGGP